MTMIPPKIKKLPNLHKPIGMQKRQPPAPPQGKGILNQMGKDKMRNE
jgi:hypothetical protein